MFVEIYKHETLSKPSRLTHFIKNNLKEAWTNLCNKELTTPFFIGNKMSMITKTLLKRVESFYAPNFVLQYIY